MSMDLSSATSDLSNNLGAYADLSNNGDFITIEGTTDNSNNDFRIEVVQENPIRYKIKTAEGGDLIEHLYKDGDKVTYKNKTFHFGGVYTSNQNEGINPNIITDLDSLKIPFKDDNITQETDDTKINAKRHQKLNELWKENLDIFNLMTTSEDLGLDSTVDSTTVRTNVKVFKPSSMSMDLSSATSDLSNNLGAYADLSNNGDFIKIEGTTDNSNNDFRIEVVQVNPKRYQIKTADGTSAIYDFLYKDGDKVTYKNKTFHFGGVYTSNENEGIDAGEHVVNNLDSLKIPFKDDNTTEETDKAKINKKRHEKLNSDIWGENPDLTDFTTTSAHLGLDKTIDVSSITIPGVERITPLQNVRVFKAGTTSYTPADIKLWIDLSATQGMFIDMSNNNDYIRVKYKPGNYYNYTGYDFVAIVCEENPIGYKLMDHGDTYYNNPTQASESNHYKYDGKIYRAGDRFSLGSSGSTSNQPRTTFYFTEGGIYSSGSYDGIAGMSDLSKFKFGYKDDGTLETDIDNVISKRTSFFEQLYWEYPTQWF